MEETTSSQRQGHPPPQALHHELRTIEDSAGFLMTKLRSMKDSNPHLNLLDVGAGSGTISASFAQVIPHGHVTAVDVNPDILPRARANAEMAGAKNIEFRQGDAYQLPFADSTFDVAFCHQMLTHLKAPWDALREMLRVTKPGGVVAAREGDYETECVWPESPGLVKFHNLAVGLISAAGGTPTGGRQLLSWALKAGVERDQVALSYSAWSYITPNGRKIWATALTELVRGGRLREGGLRSGLATENDMEEMAQAWEAWAQTEDASLAMLHGEILVQK